MDWDSSLHALTHPGLRLLIMSNETAEGQAALALGGQLARLAHARTTIMGYGLRGEALGQHLQKSKEQVGSGLPALETVAANEPIGRAIAREVERQPYNLVIAGAPVEDVWNWPNNVCRQENTTCCSSRVCSRPRLGSSSA